MPGHEQGTFPAAQGGHCGQYVWWLGGRADEVLHPVLPVGSEVILPYPTATVSSDSHPGGKSAQ